MYVCTTATKKNETNAQAFDVFAVALLKKGILVLQKFIPNSLMEILWITRGTAHMWQASSLAKMNGKLPPFPSERHFLSQGTDSEMLKKVLRRRT